MKADALASIWVNIGSIELGELCPLAVRIDWEMQCRADIELVVADIQQRINTGVPFIDDDGRSVVVASPVTSEALQAVIDTLHRECTEKLMAIAKRPSELRQKTMH